MKTLPSVEVQNRFGAIANIVKSGEPVAVTQYGEPTLMILPYKVAEIALRLYQAQAMTDFMGNMAPVNPNAPDLSAEDINDLVHELRKA